MYAAEADYRGDGSLKLASEAGAGVTVVNMRFLPCTRRRAASWVHERLAEGRPGEYLLDKTFVGRRGHGTESRTFAAVARAAMTG